MLEYEKGHGFAADSMGDLHFISIQVMSNEDRLNYCREAYGKLEERKNIGPVLENYLPPEKAPIPDRKTLWSKIRLDAERDFRREYLEYVFAFDSKWSLVGGGGIEFPDFRNKQHVLKRAFSLDTKRDVLGMVLLVNLASLLDRGFNFDSVKSFVFEVNDYNKGLYEAVGRKRFSGLAQSWSDVFKLFETKGKIVHQNVEQWSCEADKGELLEYVRKTTIIHRSNVPATGAAAA